MNWLWLWMARMAMNNNLKVLFQEKSLPVFLKGQCHRENAVFLNTAPRPAVKATGFQVKVMD